jgi:hypothetical protein
MLLQFLRELDTYWPPRFEPQQWQDMALEEEVGQEDDLDHSDGDGEVDVDDSTPTLKSN